jgi:hypothetical protein
MSVLRIQNATSLLFLKSGNPKLPHNTCIKKEGTFPDAFELDKKKEAASF